MAKAKSEGLLAELGIDKGVELNQKLDALINTTEVGSEAIFKHKALIDSKTGIATVELYDVKEKSFRNARVRYRNNIIQLVQSDKIKEGGIYYIKFTGKEKIKNGRSVCKFDIQDITDTFKG